MGDDPVGNVEALQKCLQDPSSKGIFWWFSSRLDLYHDAVNQDFQPCEILVKSCHFLPDGHVVFCLSTRAKMGDYEQIEEHKLLELKKCVKSSLGYVAGSGIPPVNSLGEFLLQMEQRKQNGHWEQREGTYQGEEMLARQFIGRVLNEDSETHGEPKEVVCGWLSSGLGMVVTCDGRKYEFKFKEPTRCEEKSFFSSSVDIDVDSNVD